MENKNAIDRAIEAVGGATRLAEVCCVTKQAVTKWRRRVPAERVLAIEAATNGAVTRHDLRPDIYPQS